MMHPTVFLDCDGVLNTDPGPRGVCRPQDLCLIPGAGAAIASLNRAGILAIGITNRSQVARGYISEAELLWLLDQLRAMLAADGGVLDAIFYCPHLPPPAPADANLAFVATCDCRKPKIGLFVQAMQKFPIDQARAAMLGDSRRDIGAGHHFGLPSWGVLTGNACQGDPDDGQTPDMMFPSVVEACAHAVALWG